MSHRDLPRDELHAQGMVEVVVEIPQGRHSKFEEDDDGRIWFDRRIGGPAGFPGEYGYVVGADGEDGDALDALVLMPEATFPGVHMIARVIGAFLLSIGDRRETKLICVAVNDSSSDHLKDLGDLPSAQVDELVAFFEAYRMLEPGTIEVLERQGRDQALTMVPGSGR
jgi:inorganic pyrophosphatase